MGRRRAVEVRESVTGAAQRQGGYVIKAQKGVHPTLVFSHRGDRIRLDGKTWARILRDAEIEDFRFHDIRHTWASWHVMNGTSLQELMQLAGWSTYSMALRYAHLAPGHLDQAAANVAPPDDSPVHGVSDGEESSGT